MRVLQLGGEVGDLVRLACIGLDHQRPIQLGLQVAEDQVHLLADDGVGVANPPHEVAEVEREQRGDRKDHGRQSPVPCQQQRGDGHRRAQVGQDREGLARDKDLNRADVVHQPRDDRAAGGLVVIGQPEQLEPLIHQMPQVTDDPLADPADGQAGRPCQHRLHGEDAEEQRRVQRQDIL